MSNQPGVLFQFIFEWRMKFLGIKPPEVALTLDTMKWTFILMLCACGLAGAQPLTFQSPQRQTALLELYTSEGCSSCPPAEAWLSNLKNKDGLWTEFVPVAFHVDYWNHLGWRDKLSSEEFSRRQNDYAAAWSAQNIYTPEFVLNGKEWSNWLGHRGIQSPSANSAGILQVSSMDGKHWQANFVPIQKGVGDYEVTAALLVSDLGFDVTAGENSGRHLDHDFAALSLITRPLGAGSNGYQGAFIIDNHPREITGHLALAAWVSRAGSLEPLQAIGGWLQPDMTTLSTNQPTQK